jgi:hypothetical protein
MDKIYGRGLALVLALVVGACSSDPTDIVEGDPLTQAEAAALAEAVAATLFATWEQSSAATAPAAAPARASGTFQFDDVIACEFQGSVGISGSLAFNVDDESGDGTLAFTVTADHDDCGVESDDGTAFVLNGSPNISASFTIVSEGSALSFTGGYEGAVSWATGDKSGRCSVDVEFSLEGDIVAETGSASLTGRVCGITFSHNLQLS